MGRTNYLGCAGYIADFDDFRGLFTYKSKNALGRVPDGTSNTYLFLEFAGGFVGGIGPPFDGYWGASFSWGTHYTNFGICPTRSNPNCDYSHLGLAYGAFSSMHSGNVSNTAFADGSVRRISTNIDFVAFVYQSGYADGQVVTFD
jgi:prepilin-type processing-associated H-X9-DG protein